MYLTANKDYRAIDTLIQRSISSAKCRIGRINLHYTKKIKNEKEKERETRLCKTKLCPNNLKLGQIEVLV